MQILTPVILEEHMSGIIQFQRSNYNLKTIKTCWFHPYSGLEWRTGEYKRISNLHSMFIIWIWCSKFSTFNSLTKMLANYPLHSLCTGMKANGTKLTHGGREKVYSVELSGLLNNVTKIETLCVSCHCEFINHLGRSSSERVIHPMLMTSVTLLIYPRRLAMSLVRSHQYKSIDHLDNDGHQQPQPTWTRHGHGKGKIGADMIWSWNKMFVFVTD